MTDAEGNEIGKLFVGGLSQATNNNSLRSYFSRFGEVDDAVVMMDNKTGRSRGFGYVKYREPESVTITLETKPHILDGKEIDAKQCNINMKGRNRRSLKIFVGGIGLDQDIESVKNYFKQFGRVTDVNLMMDSNKQRHRGFAFVGFDDETVVKRLINLHYVTINNKQVEIKAMEPPNFGRKIITSQLTNNPGLISTSQTLESICVNNFDHQNDTTNLFANTLNNLTNSVSYPTTNSAFLSNSTNFYGHPNTPTNNSVTTNTTNSNYDQQNSTSYLTNLIADQSFTTSYLQSLTTDPNLMRSANESLLSSTLNNPLNNSKQSIPFVFPNNHISQSSLLSFQPNNSPIYSTFPCHLIPSHFIPLTQNSTTNQFIGQDKLWQTNTTNINPTSLTLCPPNITTNQTNLLNCTQYNLSNNLPTTNLTPQVVQQLNHPINSSLATTALTPYYTLCSQYPPMQITSDLINGNTQFNTIGINQTVSNVINTQLNTSSITSTTVNNVNSSSASSNTTISTSVTTAPVSTVTSILTPLSQANLSSTNIITSNTATTPIITTSNNLPNGAGDASILQLTNSSRTTTPLLEQKLDINETNINLTKLIYPTYYMTTTPASTSSTTVHNNNNNTNNSPTINPMQNPALIAQSNPSGLNLNQSLWNQSTTNLLYTPLPIGWNLNSTNVNDTSSVQWHPSFLLNNPNNNIMLDKNNLNDNNNKLNNLNENFLSTKPSGDNFENILINSDKLNDSTFKYLKNCTDSKLVNNNNNNCNNNNNNNNELSNTLATTTINSLNDVMNWQLNPNNSHLNTINTLPSWSLTQTTPLNTARWNDYSSPNLMLHSQPWNLSYEVIDDFNTNYEIPLHNHNHNNNNNYSINNTSNNNNNNNNNNNLRLNSVSKNTSYQVAQSPIQTHNKIQNTNPNSTTNTNTTTTTTNNTTNNNNENHINNNNNSNNNNISNDNINNNSEYNSSTTMNKLSANDSNNLDYTLWLCNNSHNIHHSDNINKTTNNNVKDLVNNTSINVDLGCHMQTGASGDFHHSLSF